MKTQDEQMAFAKENQRLNDEYSRLHTELSQLKSPEDDVRIKEKLREKIELVRAMAKLTMEYLDSK